MSTTYGSPRGVSARISRSPSAATGPSELQVLGLIDVALVLGVVALLGVGVLLLGLRIRRHRRRATADDAAAPLDEAPLDGASLDGTPV